MSRIQTLFAAALTVSVLGLAPVGTQASPASDGRAVPLVPVFVQVLDGDVPVHGLTAEDFEARQRGKVVPVVSATEVASRQWIFFYDLTFGSRVVQQALESSLDLLQGDQLANDRVGVVLYAGEGQLQVIQPTEDRATVVAALETLSTLGSGDQPLQANGDYLVSVSPPSNEAGRGVAYASQGRIRDLARALDDASKIFEPGFGSHILLFSEAFDLSVAFGNDRTSAIDNQRATVEAEANAGGHLARSDSISRASGGVVESMVLDALGNLRRAGTSVHAVRLSADAAESTPQFGIQGPEGMSVFAEETGGTVLRSPDNLPVALAPLLARTSSGYRLTVQPKKYRGGGRFRTIDVRLVDGPDGTELIAPAGYYEP